MMRRRRHRDFGAILKPLKVGIRMNEIQFCIMMITALGAGFITPPLDCFLFVSAAQPAVYSEYTVPPLRTLHNVECVIATSRILRVRFLIS
jgi:TRAP-type C4-dicarboxylate transport system permease large subunit